MTSNSAAGAIRFRRRASKVIVFVTCLIPLAWVIWLGLTPGVGGSGLGPNPQEYLNRYLGGWALRFLLIALAVTPIRMMLGWAWVFRFRRMLGLYAFFYVCLHLSSYIVLDKQFFWDEVWADIVKRTYITIGMGAFLLLIPMAVTSTAGMIRRLGANRWRRLHQIIYVIAPLACIHFFMMRKGVQLEPLIYAGIAAALLMVRAWHRLKSRQSAG
jgi:methionine sulfoxide reductase heme-binding subunit